MMSSTRLDATIPMLLRMHGLFWLCAAKQHGKIHEFERHVFSAQASAQPFLVFGLLTTGLAVGHHTQQLLGQ
jgi:hypothetical protein